MPEKSREYQEGYHKAEIWFIRHEDPDLTNPYQSGTEQWQGFEDAISMLGREEHE